MFGRPKNDLFALTLHINTILRRMKQLQMISFLASFEFLGDMLLVIYLLVLCV